MSHVRRSLPACILAAASLFARAAFAGPVYVELGDTGTKITTDFTTSTQTSLNLTSPYGGHAITAVGGGWLITFSPTAQFSASANNGGDSLRVETDGKITFTLTFDTPINLSALITEGGTYSTSGAGNLSTIAGGIVVETIDPLATRESIGGTSSLATFNTDGTWTSTINLGTFNGSYSAYKFSIDNYLRADALDTGSASIAKDSFTIFLPPPGGAPNSTPLPLAAIGGSGLTALLLLFRKRLARSIA